MSVENNKINNWYNEIFYQVFVRSFYDSNGDKIGDLNGLRSRLDYLQELGVTALWINPIFTADDYHNYFPNDFFNIDPVYGKKEDFISLCQDIHDRGMKIFIDIETQYITRNHKWFKKSYKNPSSKYSDYLFYKDDKNEEPENLSIVLEFEDIKEEMDLSRYIILNLFHDDIYKYQKEIFKFWLDPTGKGDFYSGVDGFRLDHVMDDLDNKGVLKGLYKKFWRKINNYVKSINPNIFFLIESADWGYGEDILKKTNMDGAFTMPLVSAAQSFDKKNISQIVDKINKKYIKNIYPFTIIENHDIHRFASAANCSIDKIKIGAVITILLKGIPCIYYGQELGMTGLIGDYPKDLLLPMRESFKWYKNIDKNGMATWYKKEYNSFWKKSAILNSKYLSLEEQYCDENSIWNYYKTLISLRKERISLTLGKYLEVKNKNDSVFSFIRSYSIGNFKENTLVIINLSENNVKLEIDLKKVIKKKKNMLFLLENLLSENQNNKHGNYNEISLNSYEILVFDVK